MSPALKLPSRRAASTRRRPFGARTKLTLHLDAEAAKRLKVHVALGPPGGTLSDAASRILMAYLARQGRGRALADLGQVAADGPFPIDAA